MKHILKLSGGFFALMAGQSAWACVPKDVPSFQPVSAGEDGGMIRSDIDQARKEARRGGGSDDRQQILRELRSSPPTSSNGQEAGSVGLEPSPDSRSREQSGSPVSQSGQDSENQSPRGSGDNGS